jgi:serine O-acetyltransferase
MKAVRMDNWSKVKADTHRLYGRYSVGLLLKGMLTHRPFFAIVTARLCQALNCSTGPARLALLVAKAVHAFAAHSAGMDLPWRTELGAGIAISHGWGLVVSPGTKLGNNVTLFHGVTLGQRDRISIEGVRTAGCPVLEDDVWVGPHAVIVGAVTIGQGSRIAAGAFVTESVPRRSVVVGNPAQIYKSNCVPDVQNRAPLGQATAVLESA